MLISASLVTNYSSTLSNNVQIYLISDAIWSMFIWYSVDRNVKPHHCRKFYRQYEGRFRSESYISNETRVKVEKKLVELFYYFSSGFVVDSPLAVHACHVLKIDDHEDNDFFSNMFNIQFLRWDVDLRKQKMNRDR